jgi:hypothetical protein
VGGDFWLWGFSKGRIFLEERIFQWVNFLGEILHWGKFAEIPIQNYFNMF